MTRSKAALIPIMSIIIMACAVLLAYGLFISFKNKALHADAPPLKKRCSPELTLIWKFSAGG
jgi:hypothetical protein